MGVFRGSFSATSDLQLQVCVVAVCCGPGRRVKCSLITDCITANSHRHARHDKTVLSVSRTLRRCELDSRQFKTVADRKFEVRTRLEQSYNSHRHIRHGTDKTVLSCLVWRCELSRPDPARQVHSASECVWRRRHCRCDRRTHSDANALVGRSGRLNSHRLTRHRQDRLVGLVVSCGRCELGNSMRALSSRTTETSLMRAVSTT